MVGSRKHLDQGAVGAHYKIISTFLYVGNISNELLEIKDYLNC